MTGIVSTGQWPGLFLSEMASILELELYRGWLTVLTSATLLVFVAEGSCSLANHTVQLGPPRGA